MLDQHPANLMLRFVLEVASLVVAGQWAWWTARDWPAPGRIALTIVLPLVMAAAWGVFRVPGDPPNGKEPIVRVPGWLRLALELAFFGFALWTVFARGETGLGLGLAFALALHHIWSLRRIARLASTP